MWEAHERRSNPLTQADLLAGCPSIIMVPRYSTSANEATGSIQVPNSYGVNSYWHVKLVLAVPGREAQEGNLRWAS